MLPSTSANTETSSPSSSSSITIGPSNAAAACIARSSSSRVWQTNTPLPAARPSTLRTQGARATASVSAVGTPAAAITSFAKAFEPSMPGCRGARAEDGEAGVPELVADAGHERRLGADHDELHVEAPREREQALAVLRPDGWQWPSRAMPGLPGRRMELRQARRPREAPGERVLAAPGADEEHLHRRDSRRRTGEPRSTP